MGDNTTPEYQEFLRFHQRVQYMVIIAWLLLLFAWMTLFSFTSCVFYYIPYAVDPVPYSFMQNQFFKWGATIFTVIAMVGTQLLMLYVAKIANRMTTRKLIDALSEDAVVTPV